MSTQDLERQRVQDVLEAGEESLLMIPGPTRVPQRVREVLSKQMISHRGPEFEELHADVTSRLAKLFHTEGDVVLLPTSGTGALETALINVSSPGQRILSCTMGAFGMRFSEIASQYGLNVERLETEWGQAPTPEEVTARLEQAEEPFHAVLLTHCETSTGVLLSLPEMVAAIRAVSPNTLVLVDAVSSFAGAPLHMDEWDIDVVATASQKALMTPPGLGVVALSQRAREAVEKAQLPRFTFDLRPYLASPGRPPYTPAVGLMYGVLEALKSIEEEGEEALYERHRNMAQQARAGFEALGLQPLAPAEIASPTVTAAVLPEGLTPAEVLTAMREQHNVVLAGGQGHLRERIIRMGHMGGVHPQHVEAALTALGELLAETQAVGVGR